LSLRAPQVTEEWFSGYQNVGRNVRVMPLVCFRRELAFGLISDS